MPVELRVPQMGESITEVEVGDWLKSEGEHAERDENVAVIETDKVTVELPAPVSGTVTKVLKQRGEKASVGEVIGYMEVSEKAGRKAPEQSTPKKIAKLEETADDLKEKSMKPVATPRVMPAARRVLAEQGLKAGEVQPTGPGGRLLKEDVLRQVKRPKEPKEEGGETAKVPPKAPSEKPAREEDVVPMSPLRRRIAERLVEAQKNAALLTTFNEIDMSAVMALREEYREAFQKKYGIKLGLMSFFVKASIDALKVIPQVNAEIRGSDIAYRNYYDIGMAVGSGKGLVVPVLRNAEKMNFAEIELAIDDFARRAQENRLRLDELQGGTFTITNGGVFGSLLSTPIVNPPQSGILGMHAIQERPVARAGNVVIRPMMYVALTYDHRIVDGHEAVTFLRRIKEVIENPTRMLLEV